MYNKHTYIKGERVEGNENVKHRETSLLSGYHREKAKRKIKKQGEMKRCKNCNTSKFILERWGFFVKR